MSEEIKSDNLSTAYMTGFYAGAEASKRCSGCKHEPKSSDPYPTPCGECSRWWTDKYEAKGTR